MTRGVLILSSTLGRLLHPNQTKISTAKSVEGRLSATFIRGSFDPVCYVMEMGKGLHTDVS